MNSDKFKKQNIISVIFILVLVVVCIIMAIIPFASNLVWIKYVVCALATIGIVAMGIYLSILQHKFIKSEE